MERRTESAGRARMRTWVRLAAVPAAEMGSGSGMRKARRPCEGSQRRDRRQLSVCVGR